MALVSSVIVYSTPGSTAHWIPQAMAPLASVHPYLTVSGRAYSKCAGPVQSLLHVPVPSRSPHTRVRTVSPFRVIWVDSVPTALSVSCARAWNVPDTSCFAAHASGTSVTVQVRVAWSATHSPIRVPSSSVKGKPALQANPPSMLATVRVEPTVRRGVAQVPSTVTSLVVWRDADAAFVTWALIGSGVVGAASAGAAAAATARPTVRPKPASAYLVFIVVGPFKDVGSPGR